MSRLNTGTKKKKKKPGYVLSRRKRTLGIQVMFSSGYICFPLGTFLQHSYIFTSLYQHVKFNIYEKIDITSN